MFKVYGILQLTCNGYITTFDEKFNTLYTECTWSLMLMRYCQVWLVEPKLVVDNRPSTKVHIFYVHANILFAENPVTHAAVVAKVATFKLMGQKQRQSSGGFTATLTDYTLIVHLPFI